MQKNILKTNVYNIKTISSINLIDIMIAANLKASNILRAQGTRGISPMV